MGSKATDNKVAADMSPPNYRAAVQRLRTIKTKKEKIAGVSSMHVRSNMERIIRQS